MFFIFHFFSILHFPLNSLYFPRIVVFFFYDSSFSFYNSPYFSVQFLIFPHNPLHLPMQFFMFLHTFFLSLDNFPYFSMQVSRFLFTIPHSALQFSIFFDAIPHATLYNVFYVAIQFSTLLYACLFFFPIAYAILLYSACRVVFTIPLPLNSLYFRTIFYISLVQFPCFPVQYLIFVITIRCISLFNFFHFI